LVFLFHGLYDLDRLFGGIYEYASIAHACTFGVIVIILYSFLDRSDGSTFSRLWLVFAWLFGIASVMLERFLLRRFVYWRRRHRRRARTIAGDVPRIRPLRARGRAALARAV